jgi:hypothetical protein
MNHFPFFSHLDISIIDAIQNLDKTRFSGAMPYVYFSHYIGSNGATIGEKITWDYKSEGERFPPMITNLEVKPNGSMGVVRHGVVTVKFASMKQLEANRDFFKIGNAKSIVWGWNKNRTTANNQQPKTIPIGKAKELAGNIDKWLSFCKETNHSADAMVGPLIDFSFTLNSDASVDATFTVGTKTEIPAYLGMNEQSVKKTPASSQNNKIDVKLARLLEPDNAKFKIELQNNIKNHLLNYEFVKSKQGANELIAAGKAAAKKIGSTDYTPTEKVYIDMTTIIRYTVNKNKTDGLIVDISESIAKAHRNMISTSENIIFSNSEMANPERVGENDEASLEIKGTQKFLVHNREFVNHTKDETRTYNGFTNTFKKGEYGNVGEIYVDVDFALDSWYNTGDGSVKDFIDKLCTEINIAAAGVMELGLDESADAKTGNSVLTIVDYNLVPAEVKNQFDSTQIDLFKNNSTITDISFNSDLPKEIISMAMLGGSRKGIEIGKNLFFEYQPDFLSPDYNKTKSPPRSVAKPTDAEKKGFSNVPKSIEDFTNLEKKAAAELAKKGVKTGEKQNPANLGFGVYSKISTDLVKNSLYNNATEGLIDENCIVIANGFLKEHTDTDKGTKVVLKDVALVKNLYFGDGGVNKNNPLLPAELELKVLGISGITVGRVVKIKDLPFEDTGGLMQVIEVNHTVSNTWETTIKLKYRPSN